MPAISPPPSRHAAIGLLLLAALLWSLGGVGIKKVDWTPQAIASTRAVIAVVTMLLWMRGRVRFTWSRWQIGAAVAYAAVTVLFAMANKSTTAANAILLQYTAPIYIALLAPRLLGEPVGAKDWIGVLLTFGGMVLFFLDEDLDGRAWTGNLLAVASGVALALMMLFLRKQKDGSPLESALLGNILASLIGLPYVHGPWPDATGWTWLVILGVGQLGISYIAYARAVRGISALEGTLLLMLEPILNPIWVMLAIGERPGKYAMLGGAVVLATVAWRAVASWRARPRSSARIVSAPG
jgi:drug/metabolite transporter (DMT)-like permease